MLRAMGCVCDGRPDAVIDTWRHVFKWRSTKWWQSTEAVEMKNTPHNHSRWKHKWSWHNRGCVWDKLATEWVGDENWTSKRAKCQALEDKKRFVTFALKSVNHSTIYTTRTETNKKVEDKGPRVPGPADKTNHTREEGPTSAAMWRQ